MEHGFCLQHFKYPENMDTECIPMCDVLNSCGLTTAHSCCGHGKSAFYIIFSDKVTTLQMEEFIMRFSNQFTHSPFYGKFVMWMRKCSGKIIRNWMYEAPSMKFAQKDMDTIIKELDLK